MHILMWKIVHVFLIIMLLYPMGTFWHTTFKELEFVEDWRFKCSLENGWGRLEVLPSVSWRTRGVGSSNFEEFGGSNCGCQVGKYL